MHPSAQHPLRRRGCIERKKPPTAGDCKLCRSSRKRAIFRNPSKLLGHLCGRFCIGRMATRLCTKARELDISKGWNCGMVCIGRGREEGGSKGVRRSCGSSVADIMIRYSLTETGKERNFQLPRAVPAAISRM